MKCPYDAPRPWQRRCRAFLLAGGATFFGHAQPQTLTGEIREQVRGARLGSGYAQLINLSASPELSAANYTVSGSGPDASLDVYRIPYQSHWFTAGTGTDIFWRASAGYLQMKQYLPVQVEGTAGSAIDGKWSAASGTAGVLVKVQLGEGFTLEPALDAGVARLRNDAHYRGGAALVRPLLDKVLFNWETDAWLVTPTLGFAWNADGTRSRFSVAGHVARSWIRSFNATDPIQDFSETANVYSLRARYAAPLGHTLAQRPLDGVVYAGYTGFFGANKNALGFDAVAEVGAGLEWPLTPGSGDLLRLRLTAGYLAGRNVQGWNIGLGIAY